MFILTPGQIQLPVKIQTARGLYRAADKALFNRRHTAPRFFAQNLRADRHIPPKQQAQPLACQDHLQQLPAAHTLERVLREKDHGNAIIARFRERLSRLLRRFFQKSMRDLRHNANAITGRSVGILAGAMFKLFNDSQRVFYRPVRFLPADIDYRADAPGIMLRLCLQRPVLVWLYHAFLPSLPLQGSPASCSIFRVIQASSTASAL